MRKVFGGLHGATKPNFFNHIKELENFANVLKGEPRLSVIGGPPSSGKSTLFRKVLEDNDFPVLHMDLRSTDISKKDGLAKNMTHFVTRNKSALLGNIVKAVAKGAATGDLIAAGDALFSELKTSATALEEKETPPLEVLLPMIENFIDTSSRWIRSPFFEGTNCPYPIIWLDEANMLYGLPDAQPLLQLIVKLSKQDGVCHGLTSSDSFMHEYLDRQVMDMQYRKYTVGHLDKAEAMRFMKEGVKVPIHEGIRESVYSIFGGKMMDLTEISERLQGKADMRKVENDPIIVSAKGNVFNAIVSPASFRSGKHEQYGKPLWSSQQAFKFLSALCEAKGVLSKVTAVEVLGGDEALGSLVRYDVAVFRPNSSFAYDIVRDVDEELITVPAPVYLRALETMLPVIKQRFPNKVE